MLAFIKKITALLLFTLISSKDQIIAIISNNEVKLCNRKSALFLHFNYNMNFQEPVETP